MNSTQTDDLETAVRKALYNADEPNGYADLPNTAVYTDDDENVRIHALEKRRNKRAIHRNQKAALDAAGLSWELKEDARFSDGVNPRKIVVTGFDDDEDEAEQPGEEDTDYDRLASLSEGDTFSATGLSGTWKVEDVNEEAYDGTNVVAYEVGRGEHAALIFDGDEAAQTVRPTEIVGGDAREIGVAPLPVTVEIRVEERENNDEARADGGDEVDMEEVQRGEELAVESERRRELEKEQPATRSWAGPGDTGLPPSEWGDPDEEDDDLRADGGENEETWTCLDCGYEESAPVGELAGRPIKKTVGSGRRVEVIETTVCPDCYSENWNSEDVRNLLGQVENAVAGDEADDPVTDGGEDPVGYAAVTEGNAAPLFCPDCGEDANREVEPIFSEDMEAFDTATCSLCGVEFYPPADEREISSVRPRWTLPEDHYYGRTKPGGVWHIFDSEERRSLCSVYNSEGVIRGSNRGLDSTDLPEDVCGSCVGNADYLELYEEETQEVRGVELPKPLAEFATDDLSGLFAVRPDSEGVLYYSSCSRVGGKPAVEIPIEEPRINDESHYEGVSPPGKTFDQLVREYGLVYEVIENHTYVYVPEDGGRP